MRLHAEPDLAPINDRLDDAEGEIVLTQADVATIQTQISDINDVLVSVAAGDIEDEDALALLEGIFAKQVSPTLSGDVFVTPTSVAAPFDGAWLAAQEALGQVANIGTNTALDTATVEGDMVKVDGPALWLSGQGRSTRALGYLPAWTGAGLEFIVHVEDLQEAAVATGGLWGTSSITTSGGGGLRLYLGSTNQQYALISYNGTTSPTNLPGAGFVWSQDMPWVKGLVTLTGGANGTGTVTWWQSADGAVWVNETVIDNDADWAAAAAPAGSFALGNTATGSSRELKGTLRYVSITEPSIDPFLFDASVDLADVAPDADEFVCSSGQTFTITRDATGPVTTIVPAGKSAIINPDHTDTANKITITDDPTLDISATESAVLMWVGSVGNLTGSAEGLATVGASTGTSDGFSINRSSSNAINVVARVRSAGVSTQTAAVVIPSTTERIALFAVADRVANLLRCVCVTASGVVSESTTALPTTAISPAGMTAGLSTPSVVEAVAFDKVVWNQGDMVARAVQLLGSPRVLTEGRAAALFGNRVTALEQSSRIGTGSPEGVVTAPPGTEYTDTAMTLGAWRWRKATGTGNTGWIVTDGDTGWRNVTGLLVNGFTATSVLVRRVNQLVEWRFRSFNSSAKSAATAMAVPTGFRPLASTASDSRCSTILYKGTDGSPFTVANIAMIGVTGASGDSLRTDDSFTTGAGSMNYLTIDSWPTVFPGTAA